MLSAKELFWIKQRQKEYFELFGKKLVVDLGLKNGIKDRKEVEQIFEQMIEKHKPNINIILSKAKINKKEYYVEKEFLQDFSETIISKGLNINHAARLVNRDNSNIYHYAGKR